MWEENLGTQVGVRLLTEVACLIQVSLYLDIDMKNILLSLAAYCYTQENTVHGMTIY